MESEPEDNLIPRLYFSSKDPFFSTDSQILGVVNRC